MPASIYQFALALLLLAVFFLAQRSTPKTAVIRPVSRVRASASRSPISGQSLMPERWLRPLA